jgi:hypothetical protein
MLLLKIANKNLLGVDSIISYAQLVAIEGINLQKGMNFNINQNIPYF